MANHHLRNKTLSLKAKGLLSLMLSLPEDWDYTTRGLSCICKDGVDSIRVGIQELEANGYLVRERHRNENGQYGAIEYTILEKPRQVAILLFRKNLYWKIQRRQFLCRIFLRRRFPHN